MKASKKWALGIIVVIIAGLAINLGICEKQKVEVKESKNTDEIYSELELIADVTSLLKENYLEEVDEKVILRGALRGMLESLKDPYTHYLDPDIYQESRIETEGQYGGLGIVISIRDDLLTVIAPFDDTPADKAGIKAGDRIVKIDGEITRDITLGEAVAKLRGKPGTTVTLTIAREGAGEFEEVKLERAIIEVKAVREAKMLEKDIGYIRLSIISERAARELDEALANLEKDEIKGLILDLRKNPGGILDIAVAVASRFIPPGELVATTRGRGSEKTQEYKSLARESGYFAKPLVVLVDEGTASGSEIVSGAIQDHKRGVILGTKTFGKGTVVTIIPQKDGSALSISTAKWFTPLGHSITDEGILPDIIVERREPDAPRKEESAEDVFAKLEERISPAPESRQRLEKDNQLARALDVLKGILVYEQSVKK